MSKIETIRIILIQDAQHGPLHDSLTNHRLKTENTASDHSVDTLFVTKKKLFLQTI